MRFAKGILASVKKMWNILHSIRFGGNIIVFPFSSITTLFISVPLRPHSGDGDEVAIQEGIAMALSGGTIGKQPKGRKKTKEGTNPKKVQYESITLRLSGEDTPKNHL